MTTLEIVLSLILFLIYYSTGIYYFQKEWRQDADLTLGPLIMIMIIFWVCWPIDYLINGRIIIIKKKYDIYGK